PLGMEMVHAIGVERWWLIAEELCKDPFGFRNGWPDLLLINDKGDVLGVEVKVKDRLHASQIRTFPILRLDVGIPIEVWKLIEDRD
ncbi:MAG: VRR-NUC domain-containing protein, partial [Gemmatimonadota bacterium]